MPALAGLGYLSATPWQGTVHEAFQGSHTHITFVGEYFYLPTTRSYDLIPHPRDISAPKHSFFLAGKTSWQESHGGSEVEKGTGSLAWLSLLWLCRASLERRQCLGALVPWGGQDLPGSSSVPGSRKPIEKSSAFPSLGLAASQAVCGMVGSGLQDQHSPT